jgi:hypothetical protein
VRSRLDLARRRKELPSGTDLTQLLEMLVSPIFWRVLVRDAPIDGMYLRSLLAMLVPTTQQHLAARRTAQRALYRGTVCVHCESVEYATARA